MENNTILSQIGNTPLVKLKQASELTGYNIYGKADISTLVGQSKIELHFLLLKML